MTRVYLLEVAFESEDEEYPPTDLWGAFSTSEKAIEFAKHEFPGIELYCDDDKGRSTNPVWYANPRVVFPGFSNPVDFVYITSREIDGTKSVADRNLRRIADASR